MPSHESQEFKRDVDTIPRMKRTGALPDSIQGHFAKQRLGGETSSEIENQIQEINLK
jgi:hypothetical protein|tara:strand:- start:205 stop:375 length:171 start_codon:yes stop_codon:yes gene_type:complete